MIERNGFTVEKKMDATVPSMGRSIANLLRHKNTLPCLLRGAVLNPLQWVLERVSRRPSALRIIARRS
jgi:hypothetical protein